MPQMGRRAAGLRAFVQVMEPLEGVLRSSRTGTVICLRRVCTMFWEQKPPHTTRQRSTRKDCLQIVEATVRPACAPKQNAIYRP